MNLASPLPLPSLSDRPGPDGLGLAKIQTDPGETLVRAFRPFPVDCFPSAVREYVTSVAAALDCDGAFVALPVLSTLAAAIGNRHRLSIKKSWSEPASVWTALVSEGRTDTRQSMDAALGSFDLDLELRKSLVRDSRLTALVPQLEREQRGLLMRLDHLDGWLGRPNSTSARRLAEVSQWADIHGGRPISMERRGRLIEIASPAVSLLGTVQGQALSDKFLKARVPCELTSRLLFAAPPSRPRKWTDDDVTEEVDRGYRQTVLALAASGSQGPNDELYEIQTARDGRPTKSADDISGENQRTSRTAVEVQMSPEAKTLFAGFMDWVGHTQWDVDEVLVPWFAQLVSHAARLALVVHLTRWAAGESVDRMECDVASLQAGITMARWFAAEAQRVIGVFSAARDDQERSRIVEWVCGRGGLATARDLCRSNGRRYPTDEAARQVLDRLVELGVGVWVDSPAGKNGGRPYQVFSLACSPMEKVPQVEDVRPDENHAGDLRSSVSSIPQVEEVAQDESNAGDLRLAVSEDVRRVSPGIETEGAPSRKNALWALNAVAPLLTQRCVGQKCAKRSSRRRRVAKRR